MILDQIEDAVRSGWVVSQQIALELCQEVRRLREQLVVERANAACSRTSEAAVKEAITTLLDALQSGAAEAFIVDYVIDNGIDVPPHEVLTVARGKAVEE